LFSLANFLETGSLGDLAGTGKSCGRPACEISTVLSVMQTYLRSVAVAVSISMLFFSSPRSCVLEVSPILRGVIISEGRL
jgi:hypothetical protein